MRHSVHRRLCPASHETDIEAAWRSVGSMSLVPEPLVTGWTTSEVFQTFSSSSKAHFPSDLSLCAAPGHVSALRGNVLSVNCFVVCSARGWRDKAPLPPLPKPRDFFFDSSEHIGGGGIAPQAILLKPSTSSLLTMSAASTSCYTVSRRSSMQCSA